MFYDFGHSNEKVSTNNPEEIKSEQTNRDNNLNYFLNKYPKFN